jgi:outer membrane protein assembly factor BamA
LAGVLPATAASGREAIRPPAVRRVFVLGLNAEQEAELRGAMPLRAGDALTQQAMIALERNLADTKLPLNLLKIAVRPSGKAGTVDGQSGAGLVDGVELILDFRPPTRIAEVAIYPLMAIDAGRLQAVCPLRVGDLYDPATIADAAGRMGAEARRLGYGAVAIAPHPIAVTSTTLAIGFIVEGGAPPRLKQVKFPGAGWLNAGRIRTKFKHLEPEALDKGSTVTTELLRKAEYVAGAFMRAQGYLEARARLEETRVGPKGLRIGIRVEPGPRYRMKEARATGVRYPDPAFWEPTVERYANKPFTAGRLRDLQDAIEQQAKTEGFMAADVKLGFDKSAETHEVAVNAFVDEGTTSVLGSVIVEREPPKRGYGSSWYHRTVAPPPAEEIIRRQIRARLGMPLNSRVTDNTTRRLWSLGAFEDVEVDTAATSTTLVRDLVVKLKERRTAAFGASVGWADEVGPIARMSFSEGNVGGRADGLTLALSMTRAGPGGEISYFDRHWKRGEAWLGAEREPSLLWSAYLRDRNFDEYEERRAGGGAQVGCLIGDTPDPWSNSWEARVERISYDPFESHDEYEEGFDSYVAATLGYRLNYDTRDREEWESTRGLLFNTAVETGIADGFLLKWTTRLEWRRPLSRRWTYLTQGEVGAMPVRGTDVGLAHRYHAGGPDGVRGFRYRGLGPVDGENDDLHIGGATAMTWRNEARFRLTDSIQLPVFVDVGTLDEAAFSLGKPRASAGTGIRYLFPDESKQAYLYFAKNLLEEKTDDGMSIRFGFSYAFGPKRKTESN